MIRAALASLLLALVVPPAGAAARYAVGARDLDHLERLSERFPGAESLAPIPALVVESVERPRVPGALWVERLGERRPAFTPSDPLAQRQWYLAANRTFDAWPERPALPTVRVAVLDSGIDLDHPEFRGKIAQAQSFVGGTPQDRQGHGTFVAGIIAATVDNGIGIAGMAPSAELLVGKVVGPDGSISVEAEARAIRWAVEHGARVINLSLGGLRDPLDRTNDTYSPLEAAAVAYAYRKGAVLVAAVGNGDAAPKMPWQYASYPAALPHVLGVSAFAKDGSSPFFSNRDPIHNDIAAPGEDVFSTFPRALSRTGCANIGYSDCGPELFRVGEGTSFAAAQASGAAALLVATTPSLGPDQVTHILERTAVDANGSNGCRRCPLLRDRLTGWGRLDVTAALRSLDGQPPARDAYETNDDAGPEAYRLWGRHRRIFATLDFWDDQNDVYAVKLRKGQAMYAGLRGPPAHDTNLAVWLPQTKEVEDLRSQHLRVRRSARPGPREYLSFRAPRAGWYFVQVKLATAGFGPYRLTIVKS